jgi:hypothetical protein
VDIVEDHHQVVLDDMMDVLVRVVLEVDMLHVEMTMVVEDIVEDHHQVDLDIEVVKVVAMEVIHSVVENLLEVDMLHVEMRVSLVHHVMGMHLIMHTHKEVNNTCIYNRIYYNQGTHILSSFFMAKKLLIRQTLEAFHIVKQQSWLQKITSLPYPVRYIL